MIAREFITEMKWHWYKVAISALLELSFESIIDLVVSNWIAKQKPLEAYNQS